MAEEIKVWADFNGVFGELLCLSHKDTALDENEQPVKLSSGMRLTAYMEDEDENGKRDDLLASGTVEPSPEQLRCLGSRWVLRIDSKGVRHESDLTVS